MPKMKTKSGAKKRFIVQVLAVASNAVKAFKRHILTKKTTKNKRQLRGTQRSAPPVTWVTVRAMLPYA